MHDRPDMSELVAAARHYLETELLPGLTDPRQRFQTLVAAHVLGIVERELPSEEADLKWELAWLSDLMKKPEPSFTSLADLRREVRDGNHRLCASIREGQFDAEPAYRKLGEELRQVVHRKLRVANPKLASLSPAK
jgi:hypothetical protein